MAPNKRTHTKQVEQLTYSVIVVVTMGWGIALALTKSLVVSYWVAGALLLLTATFAVVVHRLDRE